MRAVNHLLAQHCRRTRPLSPGEERDERDWRDRRERRDRCGAGLVYLVCFVHLVSRVQPNKPNRPNTQEKLAGSRASLARVWRLATVTRFSAGSFSPLAALCRHRLRAPSPNILFVWRFSRAHFYACLASHSQRVPADEKEGTSTKEATR